MSEDTLTLRQMREAIDRELDPFRERFPKMSVHFRSAEILANGARVLSAAAYPLGGTKWPFFIFSVYDTDGDNRKKGVVMVGIPSCFVSPETAFQVMQILAQP